MCPFCYHHHGHPKFGLFKTSFLFLAISSGLVIGMAFIDGFWSFAIVAGAWGFFSAAYFGGGAIVVVNMFGLENFTPIFAELHVFRAIGNIVGPIVVGNLLELTGSYMWSGIFSGGMSAMGASLYLVLGALYNKRNPKETAEP